MFIQLYKNDSVHMIKDVYMNVSEIEYIEAACSKCEQDGRKYHVKVKASFIDRYIDENIYDQLREKEIILAGW